MFESLRTAADWESLQGDLAAFLDAPAVNARTDDDKTLVVAVWDDFSPGSVMSYTIPGRGIPAGSVAHRSLMPISSLFTPCHPGAALRDLATHHESGDSPCTHTAHWWTLPARMSWTEIGAGGEGSVYRLRGNPAAVAKIYHAAASADKASKLAALTAVASPTLTGVASWPTRTVIPSAPKPP